MRYREGDKVQIIDQDSEFFNEKGIVLLIGKHDGFVWIAFPPSKSTGNRFIPEQIKLIKSAIKGKEIEPSGCCISNTGYISAKVLLEECPIKRQFGLLNNECTCIETHLVWSLPACEHYKGLREVVRGGRKVWRVFCDAVEV